MTRCYIIYVPTLRCILLYSGSKNYLFLFSLFIIFFYINKKLLLTKKLQTLNKKKKKTMKKCHIACRAWFASLLVSVPPGQPWARLAQLAQLAFAG